MRYPSQITCYDIEDLLSEKILIERLPRTAMNHLLWSPAQRRHINNHKESKRFKILKCAN